MIIRMVERSYRMRERAGVKGEAYERRGSWRGAITWEAEQQNVYKCVPMTRNERTTRKSTFCNDFVAAFLLLRTARYHHKTHKQSWAAEPPLALNY